MKTLVAAFVLALLAIAGAYLTLSLVGVEPNVAGPIATTIIGGVPFIRESLAKQVAARTHPQGSLVLPFDRFGISAHRLVLYGSLMLFAAIQFGSVFGGFLGGVLRLPDDKLFITIAGASVLVVFPATFLIGRWVGRRCVSHGLLSVFLIALLARSAVTLVDVAFAADEVSKLMFDPMFGQGPVMLQAGKQVLAGVIAFTALGALGYWRGRRQRLGSYLGYLLRNVPEQTRRSIVELAFEEAERVSRVKPPLGSAKPEVES